MGQFDRWANRKINQHIARKRRDEADAALRAKNNKEWEIKTWAKRNPSLAAYDNDGRPIGDPEN